MTDAETQRLNAIGSIVISRQIRLSYDPAEPFPYSLVVGDNEVQLTAEEFDKIATYAPFAQSLMDTLHGCRDTNVNIPLHNEDEDDSVR